MLGLHVLLCGTTDSHKHFHPYSLNICTIETEADFCFMYSIKKVSKSLLDFEYRSNCLFADAAPAIHNGFKLPFGYKSLEEFKRVICWSHCERNCEEKSNGIGQQVRDSILSDIKKIQVMPNTESFSCAIKLFFDKWQQNDEATVFLKHFKNEWVDKNCTWYEGFALGQIPSTDNGLERLNREIKERHTLRERMRVSQYLIKDWDRYK